MSRIVALIDMDCFYVQVEERLKPEHKGHPCAVVQYTQQGCLIAVNYEARPFGVKRGMRADEAKKLCPDLHLFRVPELRGKANLTRYREAGSEVLRVFCSLGAIVERASIDEAYLDLTTLVYDFQGTVSAENLSSTIVAGSDNLALWIENLVENHDVMLLRGAKLMEDMRAAVLKQTSFTCSAGVSYNKPLAKLACGLNKPNKQTILPQSSVPEMYETIPVSKLRNLGGKLGNEIQERLGISTMGELSRISLEILLATFGEKTGRYLHQLSRGIDNEPVVSRHLAKSIGCGKNFYGKLALKTVNDVRHWVDELVGELVERLLLDRAQNKRVAKLLTVSIQLSKHAQKQNTSGLHQSRSCPLASYDKQRICQDVFSLLSKGNTASHGSNDWTPALFNISLSATKFEDETSCGDITRYFSNSMVDEEKLESFQDVNESLTTTELKENETRSGLEGSKIHTTPSNSGGSIISDPLSVKGSMADQLLEILRMDEDDVKIVGDEVSSEPVGNSTRAGTLETYGFVNADDATTSELTQRCPKCGSSIPIWSLQEHEDFHLAQELSREMMAGPSSAAPAHRDNKPAKKRKGSPRKETVKMKTLTHFFKSTAGNNS